MRCPVAGELALAWPTEVGSASMIHNYSIAANSSVKTQEPWRIKPKSQLAQHPAFYSDKLDASRKPLKQIMKALDFSHGCWPATNIQ